MKAPLRGVFLAKGRAFRGVSPHVAEHETREVSQPGVAGREHPDRPEFSEGP